MRRQVFEKFKAWKTNPDRKPLILRGARQVGKILGAKGIRKA